MEGVSRHGRAAPVCRPPARGREDGAAVRRVRDLPENRLQDLSTATRTAACAALTRSQPAARIGTPIGCRAPIEATIVRLKREYPGWGAPKIREKLRQQLRRRCRCRRSAPCMRCSIGTGWCTAGDAGGAAPTGTRPLAADRPECALVRRLQRRVHARQSAVLLSAHDHRLRQPLSARRAKRCRRRRRSYAFTVFERTFKEFGLPLGDSHRQRRSVRLAPHALYRLSKLAVWWLRLGIQIERIKPGPSRSKTAGMSGCI